MKKPELSRRDFLVGTATAGAAAALALAGCTSSKSSPGSQASSAESAPAPDEITAAMSYSSTTYNPIGNSTELMLAAGWHVFEGLYDLDLHDYRPYNALASGDPVKIDETTYEVALRKEAKFSDGTDVTVGDVVYAFKKNMKNDAYSSMLSFIESVSAKDDSTITFKLKYPFEALLKGRLTIVKIFPKAAAKNLETMPIGSGPWAYDTINGKDGGSITFVPNEYYNGKYPATCKKMVWNVLVDPETRTTAITDGSVLAIENAPDATADQIAETGAAVEYVPSFELPFLMFNTKKKPFDDVRVRQAFFYAIDYDKLIASAMDGHATATTCFLPEFYANYHRASKVYTYDPTKARSLLEEAGVSDLSFKLRTNSNWVQVLAEPILEDLKAVGIQGENVVVQNTKMFKGMSPEDAAKADSAKAYDVALSPGDPTCFGNDTDLLLSWWYGDNIWTRGRTYWADSPEFEKLQELMQQAREEARANKQQELWNQCFDIVAEQVPLYPLFHREVATAYQSEKLENFSPIATTGLVFLGVTPL